jgi:glycine cleavage system T protein
MDIQMEKALIHLLPLHNTHEALGAVFTERGEYLVPEIYGDTHEEYEAVKKCAGLVDLSDRGKLRLGGKDHLKFLQGMLTNDVLALKEGKGMYAAILTVKGRMVSDMRVYREGDSVLLDLEPGLNIKVGGFLTKYRLSYKASIDDLTRGLGLLSIQGPAARRLAADIIGEDNPLSSEYDHGRRLVAGTEIMVARADRTGSNGYDIYATSGELSGVWEFLMERGKAYGIKPVGSRVLDTLRIEAGIPVYGIDMDDDTIPIEAGLWNALNFEKGCFVGQEVVARIKWRGHVNRHLRGLIMSGEGIPERGSEVFYGEKKIGRVTSWTFSPGLQKRIALGYLRREYIGPGTRVLLKLTDGASEEAVVSSLPFPADSVYGRIK